MSYQNFYEWTDLSCNFQFDKYYPNELDNPADEPVLIAEWSGQRFLPSVIDGLALAPAISNFTAAAYNGLAVYAYTVDFDGSNDTDHDKEIYAQVYDFATHRTFKPIRITKDSAADALPHMIRYEKDTVNDEAYTVLFWYRNSNEIVYINFSNLVKTGINDDGTLNFDALGPEGEIVTDGMYEGEYVLRHSAVSPNPVSAQNSRSMADYKAIKDGNGNLYIIWTQPAEGRDGGMDCYEVFATALVNPDPNAPELPEGETRPDGLGMRWADPYRLTYSYLYNDEAAAAIDKNGRLMIVHNQYAMKNVPTTEVTLTGGEYDADVTIPGGVTDLKLMATFMTPKGTVEPTDITLSDETPNPGDTVTVRAEIKNTGLTPAKGFSVSVKHGGAEIFREDTDTYLLPGNPAEFVFDWTAPEDFAVQVMTAETKESGYGDVYSINKQFTARPDYSLENLGFAHTEDGLAAVYTVTNSGNAASNPGDKLTVTFTGPYDAAFGYSENERLMLTDAVSIAPGETAEYANPLNIPPGAFDKYGYIAAIVEITDAAGEALTEVNLLEINPVMPISAALNGDKPITVRAGESVPLTLDVISNFDYSAVFGTDDTAIAAAEDGVLYARGAGETNAFAVIIPSGMHISVPVTVTEGDAPPPPDDTDGGWVLDGGYWYYYENGAFVTEWLKWNNMWFYLNPADGRMQTGWLYWNDMLFYLEPSYGSMRVGWAFIDGEWYYFTPYGNMLEGWLKWRDMWFWLDPVTGIMRTGWIIRNDMWFYLNPAYGDMLTGWQDIDGERYYFEPSYGNAYTDGEYEIDGVMYAFDETGALIH